MHFDRTTSFGAELNLAIHAAHSAAHVIMAMRESATSAIKADGSIVTSADFAASALITDQIRAAFPADAILTEEDQDDRTRLVNERCWIVDPIDGTQQFADGSDDFDVYIALSVRGRVVVGVAISPPTGMILAAGEGNGAWQISAISHARLALAGPTDHSIIASRPWLGVPGNVPTLTSVAASLGGELRDVTKPVSVRTFLPGPDRIDALVGLYVDDHEPGSYEWDLAVLDIVIREAGGASVDLNSNQLVFNKPDPRFPDGLVIGTNPDLVSQLVRSVRS